MKIITISREFGSGGRELGKRLAEYLGVPCYDHEIIDMVSEKHGFDKNYVSHISEKDIRVFYPSTIGHRFLAPTHTAQQSVQVTLAQHEIIRQLARCQARAAADEQFSERVMLRKMKQIDRERASYRELFTEESWGRKESYHLCVNTSGREIKTLVPAIGEYAKLWFEQQ